MSLTPIAFAWWEAETWAWIERIERKRIPHTPKAVKAKFIGTHGMTLIFSFQLPPTVQSDQVTARTLTYTVTPSGSTTPNAPVSAVVVDGVQVSFNPGDTVADFLVDANILGSSSPGPITTWVAQ